MTQMMKLPEDIKTLRLPADAAAIFRAREIRVFVLESAPGSVVVMERTRVIAMIDVSNSPRDYFDGFLYGLVYGLHNDELCGGVVRSINANSKKEENGFVYAILWIALLVLIAMLIVHLS